MIYHSGCKNKLLKCVIYNSLMLLKELCEWYVMHEVKNFCFKYFISLKYAKVSYNGSGVHT